MTGKDRDLEVVRIDYRGEKTAILTMARGNALNAVNIQLADEFTAAMERIEADKNVRVVVIRGDGRAFCAGADLKEMSAGITKEQHFSKLTKLQDVGRIMRDSDKIFIGAIQGYAVGIGFEIALACDLIVAAENAVFRFPEVEIDATITGGGHKLLLETVGSLTKAKELIFFGKKITGGMAAQLGIANTVVASDKLDETVLSMADELGEKPSSIVFAKKMLHYASESRMDDLLEKEIIAALASASAGERNARAKEKMSK